jgi:DNA-binding NarL/FixJ family response regulator
VKRISPEELQETIDLYEAGFSLSGVGKMLHLSPTAVMARLERAGIPRRNPGQQPDQPRNSGGLAHAEFEKTARLYQAGLSGYEVGELLGISHSTVLWRLRVAGVPIRTRGESMRLRVARRGRARGKAAA